MGYLCFMGPIHVQCQIRLSDIISVLTPKSPLLNDVVHIKGLQLHIAESLRPLTFAVTLAEKNTRC